jgi:hypothetical protein
MKLPEMQWYPIDDLARRWGTAPEDIEQMLETGILKATRGKNTFPYNSPERQKEFVRACKILPEAGPYGNGKRYVVAHYMGRVVIELAEVLRYEEENGIIPSIVIAHDPTIPPEKETAVKLCERLKREIMPNSQIAHELKRLFPNLSDAKIGKLVTEIPGVIVEHETYRGRGRMLLGKK